jgi:hypothetical protein
MWSLTLREEHTLRVRFGSHGDEDECLLGRCGMQSGRKCQTFQKCLMPPSSGRSPRSQLPSRIEDIEKKVVRAMLGPKRQEDARYTTEGFVTCTCHQLFITVIKSKKGSSWGCSTHGEVRNAYKTAFRKAEGKSQLGLPMER